MNTLPLVSIIIPSYNRANETLKAVHSALGQTYQHTEIIVVDDGSNDDTVPILSSLKAEFTILRHTENKGANAARNTGLKTAKGEWIAFLDSDDTWDVNKIDIMMEKLLSQPQYSLGYCSMYSVKGKDIVSTFKAAYTGNIYEYLLEENVVGSSSVPVIQKSVLKEINGFDENLKSAQDWDLWLRIADAGHLFLAIQEALVFYKIPDSEKHISGSLDAFWNGRKAFIKKHLDKYRSGHKKALGKVYSNTGFLLLNRFQETALARYCFLKAINLYAFRIKSWKGLFGSFLPHAIYKRIGSS